MDTEIGILKDKTVSELLEVAKKLNVPGASGLRKQELIFKILGAQTEKNGLIFSEGVSAESLICLVSSSGNITNFIPPEAI